MNQSADIPWISIQAIDVVSNFYNRIRFDKNFPKTEGQFCAKLRNFWKTEIYEISRFGNFQNFEFYVVNFQKFAQKLKFSENSDQIFEKLSKIFPKLSFKNAKTEIYEICRHLISLDGVRKKPDFSKCMCNKYVCQKILYNKETTYSLF